MMKDEGGTRNEDGQMNRQVRHAHAEHPRRDPTLRLGVLVVDSGSVLAVLPALACRVVGD